MNIVVVGAGAIGKERIKALETLGENVIIVDTNGKHKYKELWQAEASEDIDKVFICTPHHETIALVEFALDSGLDILVEKPLGRTIGEYNMMMKYRDYEKINVGFNYRFFQGVRELLQDCKDKVFGDLISVNMVLALGDAPGTEMTWRLNPLQAGRGAILDPGIHLIDLAMLISEGDLKNPRGYEYAGFWDTGIWEESHFLAEGNGAIFNIQSSVCRWRNNFRIEVNGTEGYGIVEGRNKNYGWQTYRRGKRWGWQSGKPQRETEELVVNYDGEDSFLEETRAVLYGCKGLQPGLKEDNERCLKFIDKL